MRRSRTRIERRARAGTLSIEIVMAVAVLALALLPIFTCLAEGSRHASMTDAHLFAQMRAQQLVDRALVLGPVLFELALESAEREVPVPASRLPGSTGMATDRDERQLKGMDYREIVAVRRVTGDLLELTVIVRWKPATLAVRRPPERTLQLTRLVARPDAGLTVPVPIRIEEPSVAAGPAVPGRGRG